MSNPELRGELHNLLAKVHLQHHLDASCAWCDENGAWDAHELAAEDVFDDFASDIGLTELESQTLKVELDKIAWRHTVTEKTCPLPLLSVTSRRCWSYPGDQRALVKNSLQRRSAIESSNDGEACGVPTADEGPPHQALQSVELETEPRELINAEGIESEAFDVFEQLEEQNRQISVFSASGGFCRQETEQYWPTHSSLSDIAQPEQQHWPGHSCLNDNVPCTPEQQHFPMQPKLEQGHNCTKSEVVQVAHPVVFVQSSPMMYPTLLNHTFAAQEFAKVAPASHLRKQRQNMTKPKSLITLAWEAQQRKKQQQQHDRSNQLFRQLVTGANLKEDSEEECVPKFCHSCGNGIMPQFKFCPLCSAPVVVAP
jgi:hypothetical protein